MNFSTRTVCVLLLIIIGYASPANILVFNPIFGFSHVKFLSKLTDLIANAGHKVTVFQPYHLDMKNTDGLIKNKTVEIINYYPDNFEELKKQETLTFPIFWDSELVGNPLLEIVAIPLMMGGLFSNTAMKLMKDTDLHDDLRSREFDVLIYEPFEITGLYLAQLLGIPTIPAMSVVRMDVIDSKFGTASSIGYVPQDHSVRAPEAGIMDRVNDVIRLNARKLSMHIIMKVQISYLETAVGKSLPDWKTLLIDTPIVFMNANPILDFAVPTTQNIVKVGGMTIDVKKLDKVEKLAEEYEKILQEKESTVLISFGTVIRSYEMPDHFKEGLVQMFKNLPNVTFIWKYERDDEALQKKLPSNVHLKKWVPQPALLGDKRIKLFMTHGGLGSIMELAYTGKPALVIPIFGDQYHNAAMLSRHGGAVSYNKYDLANGGKLTNVITEMIGNEKYEENAHTLLEVLRNQPHDPKEELLKMLDFALKFPKYRSFQPEISRLGFIEFYFLDAFLVLAVISAVLLYFIVKLVSFLISKISKKRKSKQE